MIKRKVIELENVGFQVPGEDWERTNATVVLEDSDPIELEIAVSRTKILLSVQDLLDSLQELGIDLASWIE